MSGLDAHDRAILVDLVGEALAVRDETAVAAAIDDLRAGLPAFRRDAARLLLEEPSR